MGLPLLVAHLIAAIAGVVLAGVTVTRPYPDKWIMVVLAVAGAVVNAGAVVAELV